MNSVLVFTGRSAVDGEDFRWQLLRVPEVSSVLKEVQGILDATASSSSRANKDLVMLLQSDNKDYLSSGLWRSFLAQVVQIGLFRRYQKLHSHPRFLVGEAGGFSAFSVCLGKASLFEAVMAFTEELNQKEEQLKNHDILIGHSLESATACERLNGNYEVIFEGKQKADLLVSLNKDYLLDQVITLGSSAFISADREQFGELAIVESVVMDPLLSWLLPYLRAA